MHILLIHQAFSSPADPGGTRHYEFAQRLLAMGRGLERFLYRRADRIIVNSPAYCDYLLNKGVSDAKISVVSNGVDASMFHPEWQGEEFRHEFGFAGKFVAMYAGALGAANDI